MAATFGKDEEKIKQLIDGKQFDELPTDVIDEVAKDIILTTESVLAGYTVTKRLEIITAECVFDINMFRGMFTGVSDVFGGRSPSAQKVLRESRRACLTELKREALIAGADAVIGVNLSYNEISGDGKPMLFLVASGTACKVLKS